MHIPDGFLSPPALAGCAALSLPSIAWVVRRTEKQIQESQVPLLGVMGAFVFAAQMINFPVAAGASGHLLGSALLTYTLGPGAAVIVMTAILGLQALIFQDGGVLALGANLLNMAVIGVAAAWLPVRAWGSQSRAALFAGSFLSVFVAAGLAIFELAVSGVSLPKQALLVAVAVFAMTAILEALITLAVLKAIGRLNPAWLQTRPAGSLQLRAALLGTAVVLAGVGFTFASNLPDGLEHLSQTAGFDARAMILFFSPMADYEAPFAGGEGIKKAVAGLAGLSITYAVCLLLGRWISRLRST